MQIPLKLLPTDRPQRKAAAWLVPGQSCAEWLRELTAWNVSLADARLVRLPVGLLVIASDDIGERKSPVVLPYGLLTDNFFVPVEAALNAAVSSAELEELFPAGRTCLWHPAAGLLVAGATSELSIDALLAAPQRCESDWSRAVVGIGLNHRLLSLAPSEPTPLGGLWREVQDDIGSKTPTLDDLPRSPTEPSSHPLSKLGRGVKGGLAKLVQWLTQPGQASSGAGRRGAALGGTMGGFLSSWGSGLARWAGEQLARLSAALEEERNREVSRLLHMLDSDPDAGLRYAIPFSGEPGRAGGLPGSRLMEQNVDFRLGGNGGASDVWNISPNYQLKLLARYRELANREITLGRHRRAAYIFAHLLGDFAAAARTLADGGHYREAAVLYEEKLTQPLEAAKTLERGGLWTEAIAIYERLRHDEKVGDLYQQLDQPEMAEKAYRREVVTSQRKDDVLTAARLLETKLAAPQEAVSVLIDAWPDSAQALRCVNELFQLLGRRGEHELAEKQVRRLAQSTGGRVSLGSNLAQAFEKLSLAYPDTNVRELAADQIRLVAAEYLPQATAKELQGLTTALRNSTPQDYLLRRDVQRYLQQRSQRNVAPVARKPKIELVRQIHLGVGRWKTLYSTGEEFYAAGIRDGKYVVARGTWRGSAQITSHPNWVVDAYVEEWPLLVAAHQRFGQVVLQPVLGKPLEGEAIFPATSNQPRMVAGSHPGLCGWDAKQFVMAMGYTHHGTFDVVKFHHLTGEYVWWSYALLAGNLVGTWRLDPRAFEQTHAIETLFVSGQLICGIGSRLCIFNRDGWQRTIELPGNIGRLTAFRPWTRQRIVASLEDGGVIVWPDPPGAHEVRFGEGLGNPYTCLTHGGLLAAAADGVLEVYDSRDGKLTLLSIKAEPSFHPRGLVATDQPEQFAMLMEDGTVLVQSLETRGYL
jgi:tetratricopeptide (TPR) repeat protein